jgi:hypothetical protein
VESKQNRSPLALFAPAGFPHLTVSFRRPTKIARFLIFYKHYL